MNRFIIAAVVGLTIATTNYVNVGVRIQVSGS